jgi:hypothetical protein
MRDDAPKAPAGASKSGKAPAGAIKSGKDKNVEDYSGEEWDAMFCPKRCCGARVTSSTQGSRVWRWGLPCGMTAVTRIEGHQTHKKQKELFVKWRSFDTTWCT